MESAAAGKIFNLLVTTESVSDNQRVWGGSSHGGQQDAFADLDRDIIFLRFKAKRSCHAAAPGIEDMKVEAGALQQFRFRIEFKDRFVVAMGVDDGLALELGRAVIGF